MRYRARARSSRGRVAVAAPISDRALLGWFLVAVLTSLAAGGFLTRVGYSGVGLVTTFWLFLVPSLLFVGCTIGPWLHLPVWLRIVATIATAAAFGSLYPIAP